MRAEVGTAAHAFDCTRPGIQMDPETQSNESSVFLLSGKCV